MDTSSCLLLKHGNSFFSFPSPLMLSMQSVNTNSRMTISSNSAPYISYASLCHVPFPFCVPGLSFYISLVLACFQCICILWGSFCSLARFLFPSLCHLHIPSILATYMDGIIVSRPFSIFFSVSFHCLFDFYTAFLLLYYLVK